MYSQEVQYKTTNYQSSSLVDGLDGAVLHPEVGHLGHGHEEAGVHHAGRVQEAGLQRGPVERQGSLKYRRKLGLVHALIFCRCILAET